MKLLIKICLLGIFALVVFFPSSTFGLYIYWTMFVVMFLLVIAYYYTSYWVSKKDVRDVTGKDVGYSLFVGKMPVIESDDLVRGRLTINSERLALYKRLDGKERHGGQHCREVWSMDVSDIASIDTGSIVSIRKGLIIYVDGGGEVRFICRKAMKEKDQVVTALGWKDVPEVSPGFGASVDVEGGAAKAKSFSDAVANGVSDEPEEELGPDPLDAFKRPKKERKRLKKES